MLSILHGHMPVMEELLSTHVDLRCRDDVWIESICNTSHKQL
jgi:hypothetical protein